MTIVIHEKADVQSSSIGANTRIWQYTVVLPSATIGNDCNICSHCFIENNVVLGSRVTIKNGVQIWDGITIDNDVFIGPNVTFSNHKYPRSQKYPDEFLKTKVCEGVSVGAGAVILPGVTLGSHCMVGAGAVVTKSIPPNAIVMGNPARITGYTNTTTTNSIQELSSVENNINYSNVKGVSIHTLPLIRDIRGDLTVAEFQKDIPFDVKRYFSVFGVPSQEVRGEHAHKKCHQFLMCVSGSCHVVVDDGVNRHEYILDKPNIGIHLPPMTWGVQYKYTSDAVLLVFASHYYDAEEYIRDYSEFINLSQKND